MECASVVLVIAYYLFCNTCIVNWIKWTSYYVLVQIACLNLLPIYDNVFLTRKYPKYIQTTDTKSNVLSYINVIHGINNNNLWVIDQTNALWCSSLLSGDVFFTEGKRVMSSTASVSFYQLSSAQCRLYLLCQTHTLKNYTRGNHTNSLLMCFIFQQR